MHTKTAKFHICKETYPELLKNFAFKVMNFCSKCKHQFTSTKAAKLHAAKNTCVYKEFGCICGKFFKNERGI